MGLLSRAWRLCSSYSSLHQEMVFLGNILTANGYPRTFVDSCTKRFLSRKYSTMDRDVVQDPDQKIVFLSLPYVGVNSFKVQRQIKRVLHAVAPLSSLRMIFKPAHKLSELCKLKCRIPLFSRSGVVYKVDCACCDAFYVGMTSRRLKQRMEEHRDNSESALCRHARECGHTIRFENPSIQGSDAVTECLNVKEAFKIKGTCGIPFT